MINDEPVEDLAFDFLTEKIAAAAAGDTLFEQALHDTVFKNIDKETISGIRIGDAESSFAPNYLNEMQEFDAVLILVCFARIEGKDKTERRAARRKAFQITKAVAKVFKDDPHMNQRVCDSRVLTVIRGWELFNGHPYAVVNMPIIFNESGAIDFNRRRNY